jgi:hypothetical protein
MDDQRLTVRLMSYWERLRKEDTIPDYSHFRSGSIDDIWPNCMVLTAEPSGADTNQFRFNYIGAKLEDVCGKDLSGQVAHQRLQSIVAATKIVRKIDDVHSARTPIFDEGQFVNKKNKIVKYRAVLLPFGNTNSGVTHTVVGMSWREF